VRDEEKRTQEDREAPATQRLVVADSDPSGVHASGYGTRVQRALPLLLALIVLAGCGGGGGSDKALSREEYASQADAICAKYKRQTDELDRPANLSDLANVADQVVPILKKARDELRDLNPPANEQGTADEWLDQFDVIISDVEKIRDKAKENNAQGVQKLAQPALQHNQRANQLATQLGMKTCAED
jgi:hypothetical protein